MAETRRVKLFRNGASQAVRLPAEFRFEGTEVYATRDERTGDVILSARPGSGSWRAFFDWVRTADVPEDFIAERPLNAPPSGRGPFDDAM